MLGWSYLWPQLDGHGQLSNQGARSTGLDPAGRDPKWKERNREIRVPFPERRNV